MQKPADNILKFIRNNHVVSIATVDAGRPWAASCFYAFCEERVCLILLSSQATRHAQAMLANPQIAGTIAGQPESITQIRGVQFLAQTRLLHGEEARQAFDDYCRRHPVACLKRSDVWQIALQEIKFTDNTRLFGSKTLWKRLDAA